MKNDGGPAFPLPSPLAETGMSLRDYFAAAALNGLLANSTIAKAISADLVNRATEMLVDAAYEHADAMLAERDK